MTNDFREFFPFKKSREEQDVAISFALKSFLDDDKRFVIINAPTGVGKSAIGLTVARHMNDYYKPADDNDPAAAAWFVTPQNILLKQYITDFGRPYGIMEDIKSAKNYQCKFKRLNNCQESLEQLKLEDKDSQFYKSCSGNCVYKVQKRAFLGSKESVTNYPYALTESAYAGNMKPRNVLICDEAHNIEKELSNFVEVNISERFAKSILKLKWVGVRKQHTAFKWIRDVYFEAAEARFQHVESIMEKYEGMRDKISEFASISKQYDLLRSHVDRVRMFLEVYSEDNWVCEFIDAEGKSMRKVKFRPIDVSRYAEKYLFNLGTKVLMMSATIPNEAAFCRSLGLNKDDVAYLQLDSPFPVDNRPIVDLPTGSMAMKNIEETLPIMANVIKEILSEHKKDKGVIHAHSYKIARYIEENVEDSRLLFHTSENREEVLKKHIKSKKPTVLVSPSMQEGVDLKGNLSRFAVLCKVPYPFLGDPIVKKRMEKWPDWYGLQTVISIIQSIGRSVRSKDDKAVTYLLDSGFNYFIYKNKDLFPKDFNKCRLK